MFFCSEAPCQFFFKPIDNQGEPSAKIECCQHGMTVEEFDCSEEVLAWLVYELDEEKEGDIKKYLSRLEAVKTLTPAQLQVLMED